jgi:hypothetical protein
MRKQKMVSPGTNNIPQWPGSLDDMIDQLLHSNALSLKLTANPLLADRAVPDRKYLYQALPPTIRRRKNVPTARCLNSTRPGWRSRYRRRQKTSFIHYSAGSEATSSQNGSGGKKTFQFPDTRA